MAKFMTLSSLASASTFLSNATETMITKFLCGFLLSAYVGYALEIPAGGEAWNHDTTIQRYVNADFGKSGKLTEEGIFVDVTVANPAKPFNAQFSQSGGEVKKGEIIFAVIKARAITDDASAGAMVAKLQLKKAPYTSLGSDTRIEISSTWQDYPLSFTANADAADGEAAFACLTGQKKQRIEIASIKLFRYPAATDVTNFPRIRRSYPGREVDAPWRQEALARIEKIRKADLSVTLHDTAGKPLANEKVTLSLSRNEFGFGSAVPVKWFVDPSTDGQKMREIVDRYFSIVVFENDLKDFNWAQDKPANQQAKRNADMTTAFDWLEQRKIRLRGHYLMQVATPPNLAKITDNEQIREHFMTSAKQRIAFADEHVCEWDVINHPIAWEGADLLNKRQGLESLDRDIFRLARGISKKPFFVNEDQVFRPGPQHDETYRYIKQLNDAGLTVAGLGNQAHFHESYLPSMEHVLQVTHKYAEIVPRQAITEFDIVTDHDEELAADFTRDLLIACFSDPAYDSFLYWGFWEGSHWRPETASWNKDWSIRQRGKIIEEWIGKKWRTEVTVTTDANGVARWRGFTGWYLCDGKLFEASKSKPNATLIR